MQTAVADTSVRNYLVLIGEIGILPALFGGIVIPHAVYRELTHGGTPAPVREWIVTPPAWLSSAPAPTDSAPDLFSLDDGEREVVALASRLGNALVLMDDRAGVIVARSRGLRATGTLGLLDLAAERRLIDVEAAMLRLSRTSFRIDQRVAASIVQRHGRA